VPLRNKEEGGREGKLMGRPLCVKGKQEGKGRKGQSREERCQMSGCGVGGAYGRELKQGRSYRHRRTNNDGGVSGGLRGPANVVYG